MSVNDIPIKNGLLPGTSARNILTAWYAKKIEAIIAGAPRINEINRVNVFSFRKLVFDVDDRPVCFHHGDIVR